MLDGFIENGIIDKLSISSDNMIVVNAEKNEDRIWKMTLMIMVERHSIEKAQFALAFENR